MFQHVRGADSLKESVPLKQQYFVERAWVWPDPVPGRVAGIEQAKLVEAGSPSWRLPANRQSSRMAVANEHPMTWPTLPRPLIYSGSPRSSFRDAEPRAHRLRSSLPWPRMIASVGPPCCPHPADATDAPTVGGEGAPETQANVERFGITRLLPDPNDVEDPDQVRILVEVEAHDAAARPEHGLTEAGSSPGGRITASQGCPANSAAQSTSASRACSGNEWN